MGESRNSSPDNPDGVRGVTLVFVRRVFVEEYVRANPGLAAVVVSPALAMAMAMAMAMGLGSELLVVFCAAITISRW